MFSLVLADGERLLIDARDTSSIDRFATTRPALCEYVPAHRNATGKVALLMVANAPAYLFRRWGPFLNKLLFATDAGLRPMIWLGDMPHGLCDCTASASAGPATGECSNHYVKLPATLAALANPGIRGLYYLGLDATIRFPWTHDGAPGISGKLLQEQGSRFYARDSKRGRAFFASWFDNRCTFKDQYSLWHTILNFAASEGCVDYDGEILAFRDPRFDCALRRCAGACLRRDDATGRIECLDSDDVRNSTPAKCLLPREGFATRWCGVATPEPSPRPKNEPKSLWHSLFG